MSIRSQNFAITGSTSLDVADTGIQSVEGEPAKRLIRIDFTVSGWNGAVVKAFEGQTQKQGNYDTAFQAHAAVASMTAANTPMLKGFDVDRELTVGNPYFLSVGAAGTATSIRGSYVYEQAD
jgi:hypothetical protein